MEDKSIKPFVEQPKAAEEFQGTAKEFNAMVKALFKTTDMHRHHDALMHAAIGIAGEVEELHDSLANLDRKNFIEEAGDMEFYIEALKQSAGMTDDALFVAYDMLMRQQIGVTCTPIDGIRKAASKLLDMSKKCWVYGKFLDEVLFDMTRELVTLTIHMDKIYLDEDVETIYIRKENMIKLIGPKGRYRDKMYSDAAAQARADKKWGE